MNLIRTEVPLFIALMITWVSGQDCGNADLTDYYGTLKSPNYPGKYEHESDCMWTITAPENYFIELEFNDFDVKNPFWDCNFDYVTVMYDDDRSEKFCNHQKPDGMKLKSTSNVLKIHLKSDNFFLNGNGFQATYYVVDEHGNKLEEEEEVEKPAAEETTTAPTTTTTTTTKPTTTTKLTTTTKPTTTTKLTTTTKQTTTTKPTTTTKSTTTSTLISKIRTTAARAENKESTTSSGNIGADDTGIESNPGAMSGLVIAAIIGVVLIVLFATVLYAFVRYRRNKNKRIHLNVIETSDQKELITNNKIYKKVPEDEDTFPL